MLRHCGVLLLLPLLLLLLLLLLLSIHIASTIRSKPGTLLRTAFAGSAWPAVSSYGCP
jgi:hypothetical protein